MIFFLCRTVPSMTSNVKYFSSRLVLKEEHQKALYCLRSDAISTLTLANSSTSQSGRNPPSQKTITVKRYFSVIYASQDRAMHFFNVLLCFYLLFLYAVNEIKSLLPRVKKRGFNGMTYIRLALKTIINYVYLYHRGHANIVTHFNCLQQSTSDDSSNEIKQI